MPDIVIAGATFRGVPSIDIPKEGGGTASFTDVSATTAQAADVAQGKQFYDASGALTTGTASGGGGSVAELVQKWTYDKLWVTDEGETIPAYTTTATTLRSSATLGTITVYTNDYDYYIVGKMLVYPIYSSRPTGTFEDFFVRSYLGAYLKREANTVTGAAYGRTNGSRITLTQNDTQYNLGYGSDASTFNAGTFDYGVTMGANYTQWSASSTGGTASVKSPTFKIRGGSSYLNQASWELITDIRFQYIFELYRAKSSDVCPMANTALIMSHIFDCMGTETHTLT